MPNMNINPTRKGTAGLLVLRLAVAGILGWAGYNRLTAEATPPAGETPIVAPAETTLHEAIVQSMDAASPTESTTPSDTTPPIDTTTPAKAPSAVVNAEGVKMNLGWNTVAGGLEIGVAAALLLGLFTRLVSLLGFGAMAGSAAGANGVVTLPAFCEPLVQAYQSNPPAVMLLGAIFLALLVGGAGPLALRFRAPKGAAAPEVKTA